MTVSLRARVMLGMFVLALLSSTVLALGAYLASEDLEETVLSHTMEQEVAFLDNHLSAADVGQHSALLSVYRAGDAQPVPAAFAGLTPGQHHAVALGDLKFQVLVRGSGAERMTVAYDISEWERRERRILMILLLGVGLITLLAIPLGYWLSRQIMAPVTALASRVESSDPVTDREPLVESFRGQEVESIAAAVDGYTQRLRGFIEREQMFTSSASHELRTPLSVLKGALEILEEEPRSDRGGRAIERMSRAVREMSEYIDALMLIAREEKSTEADAKSDIAELVRIVVEEQQLVSDCRLRIETDLSGPLLIPVPASMPSIVISNLLRNALIHGQDGAVCVTLHQGVLKIADSGPGIDVALRERVFERGYSTRAGGTGMGLFLARQICERYGWQIELQFPAAGGTVASIVFEPPG